MSGCWTAHASGWSKTLSHRKHRLRGRCLWITGAAAYLGQSERTTLPPLPWKGKRGFWSIKVKTDLLPRHFCQLNVVPELLQWQSSFRRFPRSKRLSPSCSATQLFPWGSLKPKFRNSVLSKAQQLLRMWENDKPPTGILQKTQMLYVNFLLAKYKVEQNSHLLPGLTSLYFKVLEKLDQTVYNTDIPHKAGEGKDTLTAHKNPNENNRFSSP